MNGNKLNKAIESIDGKYIEKYAEVSPKRTERRTLTRRAWFAIAACLTLVIGLTVGTAVYAEAREYRTAVEFFEENGLSAEGLTRAEVRAVYKDITTESFTYSKTAEVIAHNLGTSSVPGYELSNETELLEKETAKQLWDAYVERRSSTGVRYYTSINYIHHEEGDGWNEEKGTRLEKYDGMNLVWTVDLDGFYVEDHRSCGDGIIMTGLEFDADYNSTARVVRVDGRGNILWNIICGERGQHISAVLVEDDGSFTVFSDPGNGGGGYWFTRISGEGRILGREFFEHEHQRVTKAVHYHDGYLVQLFDYQKRGIAEFVLLDRDGAITDKFTYSSDDEYWFINDMIEYEGRIYLSVDAMPKEGSYVSPENPDFITQRSGLQPALEYAFRNWISNGSTAPADVPGLTEKVRERCKAMLLILDPDGGEPREFWSVEGAAAGKLTADGDGLHWDVWDIGFVEFSPGTNAFSLIGTCKTVRYRFNSDGTLAERTETDEMKKMYW